jgi:hypothetical protein
MENLPDQEQLVYGQDHAVIHEYQQTSRNIIIERGPIIRHAGFIENPPFLPLPQSNASSLFSHLLRRSSRKSQQTPFTSPSLTDALLTINNVH